MSLVSRINRLIDQFGTDDDPRNILLWYGSHFQESWIEWGHGWSGSDVSFHVKTPDGEVCPMDFLTAEQRAEIRPGDSVVMISIADNKRDAHLELNKPPWKRTSRNFTNEGVEGEQRTDDLIESIDESGGGPCGSPQLTANRGDIEEPHRSNRADRARDPSSGAGAASYTAGDRGVDHDLSSFVP